MSEDRKGERRDMGNISAAFAVDGKIAEKLGRMTGEEAMNFILGRTEHDDFGRHLKGIEELDEYCEKIFAYLREQKGINLQRHGRKLNDSNHDNLLILMESNYMKKTAEQLGSWKPADIAEDYEKFVAEYGIDRELFTFYRFVTYVESIRELAEAAVKAEGTILFSLG